MMNNSLTSTPDEGWYDEEPVRPVRPTRRGRVLGMGAAVLCAAGGMAALWHEADRPGNGSDPSWADRPAAAAPVEPVAEDSPGFNCWTMGNKVCGVDIFVDGFGTLGAVLPVASDGRVHVAWDNGQVTPSEPWMREVAWEQCVRLAEGGDASLAECDAAWQQAGDWFDMRTR